MRKARLNSVLLSIAVFILVFLVGTAKGMDKSFVISPKQEAIEYVGISGCNPGYISGNLSVSSSKIDFSIRDPCGIVVQQFLNASTASFSFVADKNGNHSLCMDNTYEAFDVTAHLDYDVVFKVSCSATLRFNASGFVTRPSIGPPHPLSPGDDDGSDYVIGPYLTIQEATQMLRVIDSGSPFLPLRGVTLIRCTIASAMILVWVAGIELSVCKRRLNLRQIYLSTGR
jgi:hypothetical protein